MADCCNEFTRSQLLQRAAAQAGNGLPAVEPGMPLPAGTGLTRRLFVLRSAGLALAVYGASRLPFEAFEEGIASAGPQNQPVLVSVFLDGGIDSLSLLAPVGDPRYAALRPNLALPPDAGTPFSEDPRLRWHPAAASLAALHAEGKVTVFPAIGYASPNRSHFTSRHFWQIGELDTRGRLGWLGRYLDHTGADDNPLQGLSLSRSLDPSLASSKVPVAALPRPGAYTLTSPGVGSPVANAMHAAFADLGARPASGVSLAAARKATAHASKLREQLSAYSPSTSPVAYPTGHLFSERLAGLAAMLAAGLPIRCATLTAAGAYDTHANQRTAFENGVRMTADSLLAFQRDLEARGIADRVLVHVWSEFGRRAYENSSGGTDHGAGGIAFTIGTRARGQMVGEFPGLATLDPRGDLRSTSDFRGLYCALLEQWLGADAAAIIPGASSLARPQLLKL